MAKNLIIVESPAKAKTISKFLGKDYEIKASMGHIRDLPKKKLGIDVENNFKPSYTVDTKKKKIISELKKYSEQAENIYLAPDHDREGEAIAWHLAKVLKKEIADKPVYRITFNEITKKAIVQAIENPGEIDINKVNSQQARRILDRIVGYNFSPLLWKVITKSLSAGRVQSVALRLVCEREKEIQDFIPEEYWNFELMLNKDSIPPFKASLKKWNGKKLKVSNEKEAIEIFSQLENAQYEISKIKDNKRKIQPPAPYITSTIQQEAARLLYFSAKKTMMVAQKLYEGIELEGETVGLITYMRTDSLRIANEAMENCRNLIGERFGKDKVNSSVRVYKNKNRAQDAHEAIRPTDAFRTPESISKFLSEDESKLYALIWKRFVATQMIPMAVKARVMEISASHGIFVASGNVILDEGFMQAYPHYNIIAGETIDDRYKEQDILDPQDIKKIQKFTKPSARYTEALLIKELESKGIGRPSTYATITNTIIVRKYVKKENKRFSPTDLGLVVNKFLISNFEHFFNVTFTADMENALDQVEFGKAVWHELLAKYYNEMKGMIDKVDYKEAKKELIEVTDIKCDKCGNPMIIKWSSAGQFLACSNFPKCKNIKNFKREEDDSITIIEDEKMSEKCPKCEHDLVVKNGRFGKFIACSNYPKCRYTAPFTTGIKCPDCEDGLIVEKKNKKGKFFWSCSNYPTCKFITNYKPVEIKCTNCGNHYLEERSNKTNGDFKKCPKCGKEYF